MGFDYRKLRLSPRQIRRGLHRDELGGGAAQWQRRGAFQLALLQHLGLRADSRVLDVGCGPLRGGLPLIGFVGGARYRGVDSNLSLVEAAHFELDRAGLAGAKPRVSQLADFALATLGERFDFVLCFSVLNHCTRDERERFLAEVPAVLAPGCRLVVTHASWVDALALRGSPMDVTRRYDGEADLPPALAPSRWGFPAGEGGPLPIVVLAAREPDA
jgi:SAM-dependent methyltransferase